MAKQRDYEKAATNPYDLNSPAPLKSRTWDSDATQKYANDASNPYNLDTGPATPDIDKHRNAKR